MVIISEKIYQVLRDGKKGIFAPGHTYSGTPMAGAVGVIVGDVRGKGFLLGIELLRNQETLEPFNFEESGKVANLIAKKAFENGLILYPGGGTVDGHRGDHILIAPPFIIEKREIDEMISILDQTIGEVEKDLL